jgi:hypothetical protein
MKTSFLSFKNKKGKRKRKGELIPKRKEEKEPGRGSGSDLGSPSFHFQKQFLFSSFFDVLKKELFLLFEFKQNE